MSKKSPADNLTDTVLKIRMLVEEYLDETENTSRVEIAPSEGEQLIDIVEDKLCRLDRKTHDVLTEMAEVDAETKETPELIASKKENT